MRGMAKRKLHAAPQPPIAAAPIPPPTPPEIDDLVGYPEASRLTGWPLGTLYAKVSRGEIAHVRLGPKSVRFARRDLAAMVAAGYHRAGGR